MMACKTLLYWMVAYLFYFAFDPVTCVQHNTTSNSSILLPTTRTTQASTTASPAARSTAPQATRTSTSLASISTPTSNIPNIFITLFFSMSWKKFCPLSEKFRGKFSTHLIEQNEDKVIHVISATRIRYVNVDRFCEGNSYGDVKAMVEMYISKKGDFGIVDEDMTINAYRILDDYVVNKKMSKIDVVFANKVQYVSISGIKAPKPRKRSSLTEFDKVGIGIGASLVVIFVAAMIYRRRKAYLRKSTTRQAEHELQVLRPIEDT